MEVAVAPPPPPILNSDKSKGSNAEPLVCNLVALELLLAAGGTERKGGRDREKEKKLERHSQMMSK